MLDHKTLYVASAAMTAMMTLINYLTWRANKNTPGVLLYIFYPLILFAAISMFALHSFLSQWQTIGIANTLLFLASIIHCWAISQFLGQRGVEFRTYLFATLALLSALIYYAMVDDNLRKRILISDLQHIVEAILLSYYFIRYARKQYPNGSIVYLIVLGFIFTAFIGRTVFMGEVDQVSLFDDPWFSIAIFFNGVLAPIFYATGMALLCNERRELNLNNLTEKAQKDLEIRGLFLSTISHEIRTPLNGILGSAQLVLNRSHDQHSKAYCEAIINSAESLNLLIDKVLDYASLDQSDEVLSSEDVELKSWLDNLCLLMSPLAEQKKLTFTLLYDLPDQVCYYCDQQKLRQILLNLVGNAIKFTDKGEVKLRVELLEEANMSHIVRFSVVDSGPGIEEEDIDKLTEPYVQSNAGKTKGGTGLGLAITARLLSKLGSQLEIISELGKGSSFSFDVSLPVGELSLVEQRHHNPEYPTGLSVLLVEDLDLNRKIAIEFMAADEHKIKLAYDGSSAIEHLKEHVFDVVLLDMNLPDFTGQEVLRHLQTIEHKNKRTPFLAFTASLSPEEIKEYLSLGIKDVVGKPIKQEKLRQAISDSQKAQKPDMRVELSDTLYDDTAVNSLKSGFSEDEVSSIYNEFVLSARNKLIHIQQLLSEDEEQCIKSLHRQASTALQLGFNRYGLALKKIERRLLDGKQCDDDLTQAMALWQKSLEAYLQFVRQQTLS
ncbi:MULTISPECIES: ATP-binding protein [Pseudoalteromonas]|uniref:histidine kinase n=1 Tax=Pseudoalteromonas obscura TaxID=3048491 RepID=A0ABT7ET77_9GAMM|nr:MULTISPECIES: ATP-binding protein [Pseudoalteromonas]MBQ4839663.1 response regulator [Pseudoalteromonas luteoviolacea]MDK2598257.1 ATP-binding protein [Pseudoalteromonas sp. P94(2023)]